MECGKCGVAGVAAADGRLVDPRLHTMLKEGGVVQGLVPHADGAALEEGLQQGAHQELGRDAVGQKLVQLAAHLRPRW